MTNAFFIILLQTSSGRCSLPCCGRSHTVHPPGHSRPKKRCKGASKEYKDSNQPATQPATQPVSQSRGPKSENSMSLEERFNEAAEKIKGVPASKTSNEDKLKLYSLFKQVTVGDCNTDRPGMLNMTGRAKWDAWKAHEGTSKDDAMTKYIAEAERQLAAYV